MAKRASLAAHIVPKGPAVTPQGATSTDHVAPLDGGETEAASETGPVVPPVPDFKSMMCRVNRAGWREMSRLALELDANLEDLLITACNDLLVKHNRPPVIEKRSPTARKPAS